MDYGEKIKWLKQYQYSLRKKYELEQERERLQTGATHVTPLLSGMPGGGSNADKSAIGRQGVHRGLVRS